jgi:hypothetical protein
MERFDTIFAQFRNLATCHLLQFFGVVITLHHNFVGSSIDVMQIVGRELAYRLLAGLCIKITYKLLSPNELE